MNFWRLFACQFFIQFRRISHFSTVFKVYFVQTYLCKFIFIFFGLPNFRLHVGLSLFSIKQPLRFLIFIQNQRKIWSDHQNVFHLHFIMNFWETNNTNIQFLGSVELPSRRNNSIDLNSFWESHYCKSLKSALLDADKTCVWMTKLMFNYKLWFYQNPFIEWQLWKYIEA